MNAIAGEFEKFEDPGLVEQTYKAAMQQGG
jgi:hypothetical protein